MLNYEAELKTEMVSLLDKAELINDQEDEHDYKGKRAVELLPDLQRRNDRIYVILNA